LLSYIYIYNMIKKWFIKEAKIKKRFNFLVFISYTLFMSLKLIV